MANEGGPGGGEHDFFRPLDVRLGVMVMIKKFEYIYFTMTMGKIAGCQWPRSLNFETMTMAEILKCVWSNNQDFYHDHCQNTNFS